jgi:hypothetical protein
MVLNEGLNPRPTWWTEGKAKVRSAPAQHGAPTGIECHSRTHCAGCLRERNDRGAKVGRSWWCRHSACIILFQPGSPIVSIRQAEGRCAATKQRLGSLCHLRSPEIWICSRDLDAIQYQLAPRCAHVVFFRPLSTLTHADYLRSKILWRYLLRDRG